MRPLGATTFEGLELTGAARDVRTDAGGRGVVVDEASLRAVLREGRVLEGLVTDPALPAPAAGALVGLPVAAGFRAAVADAVGAHDGDRTPLRLLLDDLPVASLIAGYGDLYRRPPAGDSTPLSTAALRVDICAGWASDATMVRAVKRDGRIPTPVGPVAPALTGTGDEAGDPAGDELAWHRLDPLGPGAMRRRRRLDVAVDGAVVVVDAMFRDTHVDDEGTETVLHEWAVAATVDADGTVRSCRATPHVLPWGECPTAAGSAGRLVGRPVGDVRAVVGAELRGTSTCTHLNDLLRSLADVPHLADLAGPPLSRR